MDSSKKQTGRRWRLMSPVLFTALLVGVLVHLAGFLLFRVESNLLPVRDQNESFVRYISQSSIEGDATLEEQSQLFDSAPLFIPTKWNAAQSVSLMPNDRAPERFPEFEPEIDLASALNSSNLPSVEQSSIEQPIDLLKSRFWSFFESFGQTDELITPFPTVGHFAEIVIVGSTEPSLSMESPLEFTDTNAVPEPVHLLLRVPGNGQIFGEAVVSQSSKNPAFDRAAQEWLRDPETIGKLPVGYLWIKIYP
ncbi:MAG: hypothetical protein ACSHYA_13290 [Opitutaceae bacterium]